MIARREGFGDLLAEGVTRLAQMEGLRPALSSGSQGHGASHARSSCEGRSGHQLRRLPLRTRPYECPHDTLFFDEKFNSFQSVKPLGIYKAMHPTQITNEKVRTYALLDNLWKMMDALGLCVFGACTPRRDVSGFDDSVLNAATGWNTNLFELMKAAERSTMMARAFNSLEGFTIKDDQLPRRLFDPKPDGPRAGEKIFTGRGISKRD